MDEYENDQHSTTKQSAKFVARQIRFDETRATHGIDIPISFSAEGHRFLLGEGMCHAEVWTKATHVANDSTTEVARKHRHETLANTCEHGTGEILSFERRLHSWMLINAFVEQSGSFADKAKRCR